MMAIAAVAFTMLPGLMQARAQSLDTILRQSTDILRRAQQPPPAPPPQRYPDQTLPPVAPRQVQSPPPAPTVYAPEGDAQAIAEAQEYLNALGYEVGPVDGVLGGDTRRAIQRFQRVTNLPATGELTTSTLGTLRNVAKSQGVTRATRNPPLGQLNGGGTPQSRIAGAPSINQVPGAAGNRTPGDRGTQTGTDRNSVAMSEHDVEAISSLGIVVTDGAIPVGRISGQLLQEPALTERLGRLLALSANFDLLEAQTLSFTSLSPQPLKEWPGRNEFERKDARQKFLQDYRDHFRALLPQFPLRIRHFQNLRLGTYNEEKSHFPLHDLRWDNGGLSVVQVDLPFQLPTVWTLSAQDARRVREAEQAEASKPRRLNDRAPSLVFVIDYQIKAVRSDRGGQYADTSLVGAAVYGSWDLGKPIFVFPTAAPAAVRDDKLPVFDLEYPSLQLAKMQSSILDTPAFVANAFAMRRILDSRILQGAYPESRDDSTVHIASTLLRNQQLTPTAEDYRQYTAGLQQRSSQLGDRFRVLNASISNGNDGKLALDPKMAFSRESEGNAALDQRGIEQRLAAARGAEPDAVGYIGVQAGRALSVIVAFAKHPGWYKMDLPISANQGFSPKVRLEFRIVNSQIIVDARGAQHFMLSVVPVSYSYTSPDGRRIAESYGDQPNSPTTSIDQPVGKLDVIGIRLGMSKRDAVNAMNVWFEGRKVIQGVPGTRDPVFANSQQWTEKAGPHEQYVKERVTLYFTEGGDDAKVIGVARGLKLGDDSANEQEDLELNKPVVAALIAKYGKADKTPLDRSLPYVWTFDAMLKARMRQERTAYSDPCYHSSAIWAAVDGEFHGTFGSRNIEQACGEVLTANLYARYLKVFLLDTTQVVTLFKQRTALPPKAAAPPVKL